MGHFAELHDSLLCVMMTAAYIRQTLVYMLSTTLDTCFWQITMCNTTCR